LTATSSTAATWQTPASSSIPKADAAGTVDAITADFSPDVSLADKTIVAVVAAGANTSTTPTFAPDGLTAHTIVKQGGQALLAGDIPAAGFVAILEYNLANTRWELMNAGKTTLPNGTTATTQSAGDNSTKVATTAYSDNKTKSFARAYLATSTQTISTGTETKVLLNTETFDNLGEFDSTTNNRFTATTAGYYSVSGSVRYVNISTGYRYYCQFAKNGVVCSSSGISGSSTAGITIPISDLIYLNINDYLELYTYQDTGSDATVKPDATSTFLSIQKIH